MPADVTGLRASMGACPDPVRIRPAGFVRV